MLLTPFAVIAGLLTGLFRGGRFENLLNTRLVWTPVVFFGLVVQTTAELIDVPARLSVFIVGAFVLIVGLCQNLHIRGVSIVVIGLSSNLVAAVANGYVPVRLEALIGAGKVEATIDPDSVVSIGALGQLEDDQTQLGFLGDIVPIGLIDEVVSFGDLILIAGLFVLAMNILTDRPRGTAPLTTAGDNSPGEAIDLRVEANPNKTDEAASATIVLTEPMHAEPTIAEPAIAHTETAESGTGGLTPDEFLAELAAAGSTDGVDDS